MVVQNVMTKHKPAKVIVRVGDYFLTSWNFTQLYFQMILSKRGSLNDCKQPNKWKEHVIYV